MPRAGREDWKGLIDMTPTKAKPANETDRAQYDWHDPEKVQAAYERYDTIVEIADHFGVTKKPIRKALRRHTDYEPVEYTARKLERMDPGEIDGLSPLRTRQNAELVTDGGRPSSDRGDR